MKYYESKFISHGIDATGVPYDLWHFVSGKTNRKYIAIVEQYNNNVYAIKFYPREYKGSKNRYSILTNDFEPRTIVNTIIQIMLVYARKNDNSSFLFIGSGTPDEGNVNTKRFRFYKRMVAEYFDSSVFTHKEIAERSLYIMMRNTEIEKGNISNDRVVEFIDSNFN